MTLALKIALVIFLLIGIAVAACGALEIWQTRQALASSTGRAKAQFVGYHHEFHRVPSGLSLKGSGVPSRASHPEFTYQTEDGSTQLVRETQTHLFEIYEPGQEVEILLIPHTQPRLAGFYSLYFRDLIILGMGLGFLMFSLCIWEFVLPLTISTQSATSLSSTAEGSSLSDHSKQAFAKFLEQRIGPVSVRFVIIASGAFIGVMLLVVLIAGMKPYFDQMRFGEGGRLLEALEEQRFEDARQMIAQGSGIKATNEFDQNALLIALEAGRMDLAEMLIKAGADVNIKSKMLMTPLRVAAEVGDLEIVKLMLAKGALPQRADDKAPPFFYAMVNGHQEVARALIEAGTDLHRPYPLGSRMGTVGDMAVLAGKQELADLIRKRGGTFLL